MKYLGENGADVHEKNKNNEIALLLASKYEYLEIVSYLVKRGRYANAKEGSEFNQKKRNFKVLNYRLSGFNHFSLKNYL